MQDPPQKDCGKIDNDEEKSQKSLRAENQKERSYYYDDAHGYEVFEPDGDEKKEAD